MKKSMRLFWFVAAATLLFLGFQNFTKQSSQAVLHVSDAHLRKQSDRTDLNESLNESLGDVQQTENGYHKSLEAAGESSGEDNSRRPATIEGE
jgi:hypothetical protein